MNNMYRGLSRFLVFKGFSSLSFGTHPRRESFLVNRYLVFVIVLFLIVPRFPYMLEHYSYIFLMLFFLGPFYAIVGGYRWFTRKNEVSAIIPKGFPFYVCLFIGWIEIFSYLVRPVITVVRPLLNVAGGVCMVEWAYQSLDYWPLNSTAFSHYFSGLWDSWVSFLGCFMFVFFLWCYELAVGLIQWYIFATLTSMDMLLSGNK